MQLWWCIAGLLAIAPIARSQVPIVSLDLLAGAGAHNQHSGGGYLFDGDLEATMRIAATVRLGSRGNTRPVLKAEYVARLADDGITLTGSGVSTVRYPPTGGVGYALGVHRIVSPGLELGVALGSGLYGGSYRGSRHRAYFGEAEVAYRVSTHTSLMANGQYRHWEASGYPYWYSPITVGLRLQ